MTTPAPQSPPEASELKVVSLSELRVEIGEAKSRAAETASWERLEEVAADLERKGFADDTFDAISDSRWSLTRIAISGFRGVLNSDPLVINLDPDPGVTVLYGPNGAGKSSISDAIEATLTGTDQLVSVGTGGRQLLWEPVRLGRNMDSATTSVTLESGSQRLHLTQEMKADEQVSWFAEIETNGVREPIHLAESWGEAIRCHRPVFAYATLERQIQTSRNLADFFENLLALGSSFAALELEVRERGRKSQEAFESWLKSLKELEQSIASIDLQRRVDGEPSLLEVKPPKVDDEIDAWVEAHFLNTAGSESSEIRERDVAGLMNAAVEMKTEISGLRKASVTVAQQLTGPLLSLHDHLGTLKLGDKDVCPVCESEGRSWRQKLEGTVHQLKKHAEHDRSCQTALRAFRDQVQTHLTTVLGLKVDSEINPKLATGYANGRVFCRLLDETIETHGIRPGPAVCSAAEALADWTLSSEGSRCIEFGVGQTNRLHTWKVARSNAALGFVTTWREKRVLAQEHELWSTTKSRVDSLKTRLRKQRTSVLESRASQRVNDLLADVGMSIREVSVQKTKASMTLVDETGSELELGMLSAGQRNAVLLAPILASIDQGPFGFVILDDPVHAFDELRIDLLAKAVCVLAEDRRVIVLTHDERFREHIAARSRSCDVMSVSRSRNNGGVSINRVGEFWSLLLDDAADVLRLGAPPKTSQLGVTDIVRGLCRQSLDNAIREFVVREAAAQQRNVADLLEELDKEMTTRRRIARARTLCRPQSNDLVRDVESLCDSYLDGWNRASHGNPPDSNATDEEIKVARRSCELLTRGSLQ